MPRAKRVRRRCAPASRVFVPICRSANPAALDGTIVVIRAHAGVWAYDIQKFSRPFVPSAKTISVAPQHSHKASNEDNHHSLTPKQILGDLNSCFGQSDVGAVAKQQRISVPIADPEADGAAQYRPQHGGEKNEGDAKLVRRSGENRSAHQDRFSRQRQTNRFQEHKREHDPSAVLVD
jgi:hypothetical protein